MSVFSSGFSPEGATEKQKQTIAGFTADNSTPEQKQAIANWGLPDYSTAISRALDKNYIADTNLWAYAQITAGDDGAGSEGVITILVNGNAAATARAFYYDGASILVPIKKGETYRFNQDKAGFYNTKLVRTYKCYGE